MKENFFRKYGHLLGAGVIAAIATGLVGCGEGDTTVGIGGDGIFVGGNGAGQIEGMLTPEQIGAIADAAKPEEAEE